MDLKKILITGVTGFLGQALVRELQNAQDIELFGHSRDIKKATSIFKNDRIQFLEGIDATKLDDLGIDTIIHLAGIAHDLSGKYSSKNYFIVNEEGTCQLYNEFLQSRARDFIFLSSIKAAIDTSSSPVEEDIAPSPVSAYGQSKLNAEKYIQENQVSAKKFYILRPCMVHGPGNKGNLNLLYKYVTAGLPFPLGSFNNQRSFLSIDNFTFIILGLLRQDIPSGIYHLADDGALSTPELFRIIARGTNKPARVLNIPRGVLKTAFRALGKKRMLDKLTEDMLVSNRKIKSYLDLPLPVGMEEGLIKTIRSFEAR